MTAKQIWTLPKEKRLAAFLDRYLELDDFTGNRTLQEKDEMAEIADAVMPGMIRYVVQSKRLVEKWRSRARSTPEEMKAFAVGEPSDVPIQGTFGICCAQLELLLESLEGRTDTQCGDT